VENINFYRLNHLKQPKRAKSTRSRPFFRHRSTYRTPIFSAACNKYLPPQIQIARASLPPLLAPASTPPCARTPAASLLQNTNSFLPSSSAFCGATHEHERARRAVSGNGGWNRHPAEELRRCQRQHPHAIAGTEQVMLPASLSHLLSRVSRLHRGRELKDASLGGGARRLQCSTVARARCCRTATVPHGED
jgi:hypothetical protein